MSKAKDMVVCVVFTGSDYAHREVVLELKNRPDEQKGLWNFPGGRIEENESPTQAAAREFAEECGLQTASMVWDIVGRFKAYSPYGFCYVWVCKTDVHDDAKKEIITKTDETVVVWPVNGLPNNILYNIRYLIDESLKVHEEWEPVEKILQTP